MAIQKPRPKPMVMENLMLEQIERQASARAREYWARDRHVPLRKPILAPEEISLGIKKTMDAVYKKIGVPSVQSQRAPERFVPIEGEDFSRGVMPNGLIEYFEKNQILSEKYVIPFIKKQRNKVVVWVKKTEFSEKKSNAVQDSTLNPEKWKERLLDSTDPAIAKTLATIRYEDIAAIFFGLLKPEQTTALILAIDSLKKIGKIEGFERLKV